MTVVDLKFKFNLLCIVYVETIRAIMCTLQLISNCALEGTTHSQLRGLAGSCVSESQSREEDYCYLSSFPNISPKLEFKSISCPKVYIHFIILCIIFPEMEVIPAIEFSGVQSQFSPKGDVCNTYW